MDAKEKKKKEKPKTKAAKDTAKEITLREGETLKELSEKTDINTKDIVETLRKKGQEVSVNDMQFHERIQ